MSSITEGSAQPAVARETEHANGGPEKDQARTDRNGDPVSLPKHHRGRKAALIRHRGPGDPATIEAARDLKAAVLEDHIRRVVATAPPVTAEQLDRLAALLRGES